MQLHKIAFCALLFILFLQWADDDGYFELDFFAVDTLCLKCAESSSATDQHLWRCDCRLRGPGLSAVAGISCASQRAVGYSKAAVSTIMDFITRIRSLLEVSLKIFMYTWLKL